MYMGYSTDIAEIVDDALQRLRALHAEIENHYVRTGLQHAQLVAAMNLVNQFEGRIGGVSDWLMPYCEYCGDVMDSNRTKPRRWCSDRCRVAASRG
jgi:hypothetical protein